MLDRLRQSKRFALAFLFSLALLPRVAYLVFDPPPKLSPDERIYLNCAHTLWHHGVYGETRDEPYGVVPFLYPMLLSPFVGLFGAKPTVVLWFQIGLASANACLAYQIGDRLKGHLAGWVSGLFCAIYLPMVKQPTRFTTETLAVFLLILAILLADHLLANLRRNKTFRLASLVGLSFALAALTRAVLLPLVALPLCFIALRAIGGTVSKGRAAVVSLCLATAFCAVYSTWLVRNYGAFGRWTISTSANAYLTHDYATADLIYDGLSLKEARRKLLHDAEFRKTREEYIATHGAPTLSRLSLRYLRHCGTRLGIMLGVHPALEIPFPFAGCQVSSSAWINWLNYLWTLAMCIGLFVAFLSAARERDIRLLYVLAVPFALVLLHAMLHAIPRYQIVPYAAWTAGAGVGWAVLLSTLWRKRPWNVVRSGRTLAGRGAREGA